MNSMIKCLVNTIQYKRFYCLFLLLAVGYGYAVNLTDSYQAALAFNADYLAAIASNDANQEAKVQARAALLPQVALGTSFSENYFQQYGASRSVVGKPMSDNLYTWYHQPIYSANVSQTIFDFSAFSAYVKSKYFTKMSDLQLDNAKQKLLLQTSQAYFDVLFARIQLRALKANKVALARQMRQAKRAFDLGTATIADKNDAQAALTATTAAIVKADNDLIDANNNYTNVTGIDANKIHDIKTNISVHGLDQDLSFFVNKSLVANIDVLIAEQQVNMSNIDLLIVKGGYMPSVSLAAGYQYTDTGGFDKTNATQAQKDEFNIAGGLLSRNANSHLQINVNMPIYNGGVTNSKLREASAKYIAAKNNLLQLKRNTDRNTQNAFWLIQNGVNEIKSQAIALKSAKIKLNSDKLGYKVGVRNSIDLVNAEKIYTEAVVNYKQSQYQFLLAKIQLPYLTGNVDSKDLQIIDVNIQ